MLFCSSKNTYWKIPENTGTNIGEIPETQNRLGSERPSRRKKYNSHLDVLVKDLNPNCMLMKRGRPIGLCMQKLCLSNVDFRTKFEIIGPASRCTAREVLLWPLRPAQVCWSSAARKTASSLTSCLLRVLRWPLPPARLPPQLALPQQGAESKAPKKSRSHTDASPFTETFNKRRKIGAL